MNDYYEVRLKHANLEYLVERHGSKVVIYRGGYSPFPTSDATKGFLTSTLLFLDICDLDFISKVFEKERPSHVIHLAARAGGISDD